MSQIITLDHLNKRFEGQEGWLSALPQDANKILWKKSIISAFEECKNAKANDFIKCVLKSVRDGLMVDGREAVILPYKKKKNIGSRTNPNWVETGEVTLTYIPMVAGVVKRIYSGNMVKRLVCHVVYENDFFDMWTDLSGDNINFRPVLKGPRGDAQGAFAMGFLASGEVIMRYMSQEEINKRREESKAKDKTDAPWVKWPDEMAKKTVIHNLFKMIPIESEQNEMLLNGINAESKENNMVDITPETSEIQNQVYDDYEALVEQEQIPNGDRPSGEDLSPVENPFAGYEPQTLKTEKPHITNSLVKSTKDLFGDAETVEGE
ncbi:recombination and repair protein recT [Caudoviricetes sp.]|nr:recombination and repair protein recT [Caudoviricetes sp.]